jgi:hypothetical protein
MTFYLLLNTKNNTLPEKGSKSNIGINQDVHPIPPLFPLETARALVAA